MKAAMITTMTITAAMIAVERFLLLLLPPAAAEQGNNVDGELVEQL